MLAPVPLQSARSPIRIGTWLNRVPQNPECKRLLANKTLLDTFKIPCIVKQLCTGTLPPILRACRFKKAFLAFATPNLFTSLHRDEKSYTIYYEQCSGNKSLAPLFIASDCVLKTYSKFDPLFGLVKQPCNPRSITTTPMSHPLTQCTSPRNLFIQIPTVSCPLLVWSFTFPLFFITCQEITVKPPSIASSHPRHYAGVSVIPLLLIDMAQVLWPLPLALLYS